MPDQNHNQSNGEYEQKLDILLSLADYYGRKFEDSTMELMVSSLEDYSAKQMEEAAKYMMREDKYFSISRLVYIIVAEGISKGDDKPAPEMTKEEYEAWCERMDREDEG